MGIISKRKMSYQWRLFFPIVITMWVILLGLAGWQYYREREYRRTFVSAQLEMINKRVTDAIDAGQWSAIRTYLPFLKDFYEEYPIFDDVRVTVYDENWQPIDSLTMGAPILLDMDERMRVESEMIERQTRYGGDQELENQPSYYRGSASDDGRYKVITALPNDKKMTTYIAGDSTEVWVIIFAIAVIVTIIYYFTSRYLSKNITILRDFANRSANDPWFIPGTDYPHDELGDIARQIVQLYNERAVARDRIDREHRMALHTIEEKARQKRQLTNNINHELKTPIGVIKGYLDTIMDTPDMDQDTRMHFISKARDHANRLVDLIADVSAITRLEEGSQQMSTEQLDYHETAYLFASDVKESGMLGHFSMDVNIPLGLEIRGNNNLLVGMLLNLTKNAVNYSQGDHLEIGYRGEDDNFYKFVFNDNGTGVPETSIEHLFDRFYRIDSGRARKSGGTGLGLAIVYNTIKAHGGNITAHNRPQGGLEFEFTLPKWKDNPSA